MLLQLVVQLFFEGGLQSNRQGHDLSSFVKQQDACLRGIKKDARGDRKVSPRVNGELFFCIGLPKKSQNRGTHYICKNGISWYNRRKNNPTI